VVTPLSLPPLIRCLGFASLPVQPPPERQMPPRGSCERAAVRVAHMVGHPCMDTEHRTFTRLTVPPSTLGQTLIAALLHSASTSTSHATSPPLTSPHARPMVSARHPTLRQQEPTQQFTPPAPPRRARPRTAGMLRVTDAPAPSCVGSRRSRCSAEGGVQVKVEEV
jgi:hypothetical protein